MPYTDGFKARMIERMAGPEGISANALAREVGVSQSTLSHWLRQRRLGGVKKPNKPRRWTAEEKLRVVREASGLEDEALGELLRREGLHEVQLQEWTKAVLASLTPSKPKKTGPTREERRISALERELDRKDKALAEVTALLALKKRAQELWGDVDDDTDTGNAT